MQREVEDLQQRLQSALSTKSSDKQTISNLERKLAEERRQRSSLESQLNQERKNRKQEEARAAQVLIQYILSIRMIWYNTLPPGHAKVK